MIAKRLFNFIWCLALILTACSPLAKPTLENSVNIKSWFDAPIPGTVFTPTNPCQIVMHGSSPSGVSLFELTINGLINRNIPSPNTKETLVTLTQDCDLTTPGEYHLQLRIQDSAGNWSESASTSLIISAEATKTPVMIEQTSSTPIPALTPTESPTATVTPTQINGAKIKLEHVSTDTVYAGLNNCGNQYLTILVTASDPQGIKVIALFYRFQPAASTAWEIVDMNPLKNNLYEYTLNLASIFGKDPPFDQATLEYQAVIQNNVGDTSLRTGIFSDVTVLACRTEPS